MESDETPVEGENPWALLARRLSRPCKQWTFYVVLVLGILILGYLAVWIEVKNVWFFTPTPEHPFADLIPLRLAYATAILAVGVPCLMQLGFTLNKMAVVTGIVLAFCVLLSAYLLSTVIQSIGATHCAGGLGLAIATFAWWLANGEDDLFQDRVKPDAASGGDPRRDLTGGKSGVKV